MGRSAICFALLFMTGLPAAQGATPNAAERAAALDAIRQYALSYTKNLPNYMCTQTTRETVFRGVLGPSQPGSGVIEEQLSFVDNKEIRKVTKINGVPASPDGAGSAQGRFFARRVRKPSRHRLRSGDGRGYSI